MVDKKAQIFNAGRQIFYLKGFKDTNVSDITKMAKVGVGTFYNYYGSKEELFLEVYIKESEKHKRHVMETINVNGDPVTVAKKLIEMNISAMDSNRILKEWNSKDLLKQLEQHYRDESLNDGDFFHNFYIDIIKNWKAEGKIRDDIADDLLLAFFGVLEHIDTHKEEIGIQYFPHIMQYLVEFIMKGLTDCRK
ncbi:TetR/AcrR family transcriptional regulator [Clostridium sp.]|uniref:TetR/AcrR family transcriptional regulator n=1 Tax=Clostridium sp. TaxID=1506 RepID=UPI002FC618EF